jgi:hypothetical protein
MRDGTGDLRAQQRKQERRQGGRPQCAIEQVTFALGDTLGDANKSGGRGAGHDARLNGQPSRPATRAAAGGQAATRDRTDNLLALGDTPGDANKSGGRGAGRDARSNG